MKSYIISILKYSIESYIVAFAFVSVVVNVLAAIKSSHLLWILNYTLWMWLAAEVVNYVFNTIIKFVKKQIKKGEM